MLEIVQGWPPEPPPFLSEETRLLYLATKEAVASPNILNAQEYLYCRHFCRVMFQPFIDMVFNSIQNEVIKS